MSGKAVRHTFDSRGASFFVSKAIVYADLSSTHATGMNWEDLVGNRNAVFGGGVVEKIDSELLGDAVELTSGETWLRRQGFFVHQLPLQVEDHETNQHLHIFLPASSIIAVLAAPPIAWLTWFCVSILRRFRLKIRNESSPSSWHRIRLWSLRIGRLLFRTAAVLSMLVLLALIAMAIASHFRMGQINSELQCQNTAALQERQNFAYSFFLSWGGGQLESLFDANYTSSSIDMERGWKWRNIYCDMGPTTTASRAAKSTPGPMLTPWFEWHQLFVARQTDVAPGNSPLVMAAAPIWVVALFPAILPAIWIAPGISRIRRSLRNRRRRAAGRCTGCGYDLRATARCPECGILGKTDGPSKEKKLDRNA